MSEDPRETGRSGGRWTEDAKTFPSLFSTQAVCHCGKNNHWNKGNKMGMERISKRVNRYGWGKNTRMGVGGNDCKNDGFSFFLSFFFSSSFSKIKDGITSTRVCK